MRRLVLAAAIVPLLLTAGTTWAADQSPPGTDNPDYAQTAPAVVKTVVHRPAAHRTVVRRFTPYAQPTAAQAMWIAQLEAQRFGCNLGTLDYRIFHESRWEWWAHNGSYDGLLQYADSTFARGLSTMPHGVKIRTRSSRLRRSEVVRIYSDGHVTRGRGKLVRQHVLRILKGTIPRYPPKTHGWAQIRIGCMALAGKSAVHASEWPWRY